MLWRLVRQVEKSLPSPPTPRRDVTLSVRIFIIITAIQTEMQLPLRYNIFAIFIIIYIIHVLLNGRESPFSLQT